MVVPQGLGHEPSWQPHQLLETFMTQSMPVVHVELSPQSLLLTQPQGPWKLQPKVISSAQHVAAAKGF